MGNWVVGLEWDGARAPRLKDANDKVGQKKGAKTSLQHPFSTSTLAEYFEHYNRMINESFPVLLGPFLFDKRKLQNHYYATMVFSTLIENPWNEKYQKPRGRYWRW